MDIEPEAKMAMISTLDVAMQVDSLDLYVR